MTTASWRVWLILVPAMVLGIVLAVANTTPVVLSLDPFSRSHPALAVTMPLYAVIFAAFFAGLVVGGIAAWLGQRPVRRERRQARRELRKLSGTPPADPASHAGAAHALPSSQPRPSGPPRPAAPGRLSA